MKTRRVLPVLIGTALLLPASGAAAEDDPTTTIRGEIQRLSVDTFDGFDVDVTVVVPDAGDAIRIESDDVEDILSGALVEMTLGPIDPDNQAVVDPAGGAAVLDAVVLDEPTLLEESDAPLEMAPGRPVHLLTATLPGQLPNSVTTSTLASEISASVGPYWSDSTGGNLTFTTGTQLAAGTYSSWGSTSTCTTSQILGFLQWSAERVGAYPTVGYNRHTVTYTPPFGACSFAGVAHVGSGGSAWINGTGAPQRADVISHELGHTVGLGHSNSRTSCATGMDGTAAQCHPGEYGDAYDVMGTRVGNAGPLNAAHLDTLGLLPSSTVVANSTQPLLTLQSVGGLSGTRFLKFATGGVTYYVEYRGATGRDADLATSRKGCPYGLSPCTLTRYLPGVVVRRVDQLRLGASSNLLNPPVGSAPFVLEPGRSFSTADGEYTLLVESVSGTSANVRLTRGASQPPIAGEAVYQPVAPSRVVDFVPMSTQSTYTFKIPGLPAGATAVALNVTTTGVSQTSYVSACASGTPLDTCRATSALNPSAGTDTAAAVLVALGGPLRDEVTLYNNAGNLKIIADLQGYYVSGAGVSGASFRSQAPQRAMDRGMAPQQLHTLQLPDVPPGATAVAVNVTTSAATQVSYISACPAGQPLTTCRATSTLNPRPGRDSANFAVVKLGGPSNNQIQLYNNVGTVRLIIDVNGYFIEGSAAPPEAGQLQPVQPVRVMSQMVGGSSYTTLTLSGTPAGATAVIMNLTSTATSGITYVSACPYGGSPTDCIKTSAFNPAPGVDTSNSVMVKLGGPGTNMVTLYNNAGTTRLIADVQGYFIP